MDFELGEDADALRVLLRPGSGRPRPRGVSRLGRAELKDRLGETRERVTV